MENKTIEATVGTNATKIAKNPATKTVSTGQLVGLGVGCAAGGAAAGIGIWEGVKALRRRWKQRKADKEKKPAEEKKEETKPTEEKKNESAS